jgi:ribosomal protein S18 acetylase RimI-like enzyme
VEIRVATLSDVKRLCNLFDEFFAYNAELQPEYCNASKESGKYPESVIEDAGADILVAIENGVMVGFIHIQESKTPPFESVVPHDYAEIMAFMVSAMYRQGGVGSKLMDAAKDWSKARNLDYIELLVLSNAKEANNFYSHYGFDEKAHLMRYYISE